MRGCAGADRRFRCIHPSAIGRVTQSVRPVSASFGLLLTVPAGGVVCEALMQTGAITIRRCPGCAHPLRERADPTGRETWPVVWTDGWSASAGSVERLELLRCPRCATVFRADDAELVERCAPWDAEQRWAGAATAKAPGPADYALFLRQRQLPPDIERSLRTRAWRVFNDTWRKKPVTPFALPEFQRENMEHLLDLLEDGSEDLLLMRAEILRQLGRFEACLTALNSVARADLMARAARGASRDASVRPSASIVADALLGRCLTTTIPARLDNERRPAT